MKKTKITSIAVVLLFALTCFSFVAEKWSNYEFKENKYTIQFPEKPTASTENVDSQLGVLVMNNQMVDYSEKDGAENLIYMSIYTEYPKEAVSSANKELIEPFFEGAINGVIQNTNGKLVWKKDVEIDGYPGKEIKVSISDNAAFIRMRMYLVDNVTYILQTISLSGNDDNKSITKFMDSFKLMK